MVASSPVSNTVLYRQALLGFIVCGLLFKASGLAAEAPLYVATLALDCDSKQAEFRETNHPITGEVRFLLGRDEKLIKMVSGRFHEERVMAQNGVIAIGRPSFGMTAMLRHNPIMGYLTLVNAIEIRNHVEFCRIVDSGIEFSIYTGNLHAVDVRIARGESATHVVPANDVELRRAIDLIGVKYFESLRRLFSNHFKHYLSWQSEFEIGYNYSATDPARAWADAGEYEFRLDKTTEYLGFYENEQLYHYVVPGDASDFRLSEAPFLIEFGYSGTTMQWNGSAVNICLGGLQGTLVFSQECR